MTIVINLNSLYVIHTAKYFASLSDVGLDRDRYALCCWSADVRLVGVHGLVVVAQQPVSEQVVHVHHLPIHDSCMQSVVTSPASEATGLGFESRWRQIISVRSSDGISKYLPYFSSYLMLIMRAFVVSVCIN